MTQHASYIHVSLEDNANCEIDNPLAYKSLEQLDRDARAFARRVHPDGLYDELFVRAARIARDPLNWQTVRGVTDDEKRALREEKQIGFWRQPKTLRVTIATLCIAAIIQGWNQTGGNGANLTWPQEFGLTDPEIGRIAEGSATWIFAGVNAVTFLSASLFGCWISDPLQSMILGRRGAIFVSGCLCLASVIGAACTHSWQQLLACRAVLGLGMGAKAAVTPIYGAEVSPSHLRGALVMNWQLFDAFGIFLGFTANLVVSQIGPLSWRFQMASSFLPAVCLLTLIWFIPESPRWLLKQGRLKDAFTALLALRETSLQAAIELFYANAQIQAEITLFPQQPSDTQVEGQSNGANHEATPQVPRKRGRSNSSSQASEAVHQERTKEIAEHATQTSNLHSLQQRVNRGWRKLTHQVDDSELDEFQSRIKNTYFWTRIWQLLRNKRTRRATIASLVVMISQQLCGVNVLQFYSSTFFRDVNQDVMGALWLSWGIGLANFLFTFPAYCLIDKHGRRFLLLVTCPGMAISMLAACLSFLIPVESGARIGVIAFWMFVFIFFYSWGQGPVPFVYSSEVFPLLSREVGMSFAVFVNLFGAGILTLFVPQLTETLRYGQDSYEFGQSRLLAIFAGSNVLALILIFFYVPETAGATLGKDEGSLNYISLEELNYIFGVPTRQHISYQIHHMLPWSISIVKWAFSGAKEDDKPPSPHVLYTWVNIRDVRRLAIQEEREREEAVLDGEIKSEEQRKEK